jgi:hypothetical protein
LNYSYLSTVISTRITGGAATIRAEDFRHESPTPPSAVKTLQEEGRRDSAPDFPAKIVIAITV